MRKCVTILLVSLVLIIISGCSRPMNMPSQQEPEGVIAQWRTEGFAISGEMEEKQVLWAGQYQPWNHEDQISTGAEELIHLDSGVCGELFWYFGTVLGSDGIRVSGPEGIYVLEIYDTVSGECTLKQFTPKDLGMESKLGYLWSMDMLDEEHYMFRWTEYEQDEEEMYCQIADEIVYTNFNDELNSIDLWEFYLENDIEQKELTELPFLQAINWGCDGSGNIYVINQKENSSFCFNLFDKNGDILLEYEGTLGLQPVEPLRTWDGELILTVYDSADKCYEFLWVNTGEGRVCSLAKMNVSRPCIVQMYGMLGDTIFYRLQEGAENGTGEAIVSWNTVTGKRAKIFYFQKAGIDTGFQTMLALCEGQMPFLRLTKFRAGKPREWLTSLTDLKPSDVGIIRVVDFTGSAERVAECAVLASMENPNFRYEYENASAKESRDRIMAELSQGKGPELMFVSLEDMYMLDKKGILLDISELISGELKDELLPGVLEIGAVGERFLGVPAGVRAETLAVTKDTWPEDTWELEDIIDLMEEGKLTGEIRSPYVMSDYLSPTLKVMNLVDYSLEDSFLIDWENRKAHFDDERFIRLLELTGTNLKNMPHETEAWLNEGRNILYGYFTDLSSFLDFFTHLEEEDGRIIGYPTEGNCGSYLVADGGVLVVNVNIAQKDMASCFLEILLGEEQQSKMNMQCLGVRKLNPQNYIVKEDSGNLVFLGGKYALEIPVFRDGTTSLDRAKKFLENCVALPPRYFQINRILSEELSDMYAENKSPITTAENINSRVQIYLDEEN